MKIKNLSRLQKKVLDACMDGWFMSGEYTAMFRQPPSQLRGRQPPVALPRY